MRAERGSKSETYGAHQHDINQTAKETLEKVQSKQTDPSHDSREIVRPHRSRPGCADQPTGIFLFFCVGRLNAARTPGGGSFSGVQICTAVNVCDCVCVQQHKKKKTI